MQNEMFRKGLVIGIIILFISASIIPNISGDSSNPGSEIAQGKLSRPPAAKQLARTSDGVLYCVYNRSDGSHSQIYYLYSINNGETWSEELLTTDNYDQLHPAIAIDSNDYIYIVWEGCHSGSPIHSQIRYRIFTTDWNEISNITTDTDWDQRTPAIAVDSNNIIHVVWQKIEFIGGPWSWNGCGPTYYSKKTGDSWSVPIRIGEGEEYGEFSPMIVIDKNAHLHVAWTAGGYHYGSCWYSAYRRYTTYWEPVESFGCYEKELSIAVDSEGNVHLVSNNGAYANGVHYRKRTSSGWSSPVTIAPVTDTRRKCPSIAIDSSDYLHVIWDDDGNIRYRKYTSSWQDAETLVSDTDSFSANFICSCYPEVDGVRSNIPKNGFAFVWNDGSMIKFYKSSDLEWDNEAQPPTEGLIGYWSFDEGTGSIAHDSSGYDNDGTISGATWTNGISGTALEFDGINDYVEISDVSDYVFNDESVTFSAWVQIVDNSIDYRTFMYLGDTNNYDREPYFFMGKSRSGYVNGRLFMNVVPNDQIYYLAVSDQDGDALPKDTWIHVTGVVDYENLLIHLYINGNLEDSVPLGSYNLGDASQLKLRFGMTSFTTSDLQHKGLLDEIRIYNRALSALEIKYLYHNPSGGSQLDTIPPATNELKNVDLTSKGFIYPSGVKPPTKPKYYYELDSTYKDYIKGEEAVTYYKYHSTYNAGWLARGDKNHYQNYYYHIGQDIEGNEDEPVYAISDGIIIKVHKSDDSWGSDNYGIFIKHTLTGNPKKEFIALYGHVRPPIGKTFIENSYVNGGEAFAILGPLGGEEHLHFGIVDDDKEPSTDTLKKRGWGRMGLNWWTQTSEVLDANKFTDPIDWILNKVPESPINPKYSVILSWKAPANDGNVASSGKASYYDIRYSKNKINENNWNSATKCIGEPNPGNPGIYENFVVNELEYATKYWFGLKTYDGAGNPSELSVVKVYTTGTKKALCSPAFINVTDPDGLSISYNFNNIPNASYYTEHDYNDDGEPDDVVGIPKVKTGDYFIKVIPKPDTDPTDTYSLFDLTNGISTLLAENVSIADIPSRPYIIRVTDFDIFNVINAVIDIEPESLNLNSSGKWITCYIELPSCHGYNVTDINISTILLNEIVTAESKPINISDYDYDGIPDLMVKFNRQDVIDILEYGDNVEIKITGELTDGTKFEGIDYIKVI